MELEETQSSMERLQLTHSIELERVQLENFDLKAEIEHLQATLSVKEQELYKLKIDHEIEIEAMKQIEQTKERRHKSQLELKTSEFSSKASLISRKSRTIQSLQEKLGQALGTSSSSKDILNVFSPGVKMSFTKFAELPLSGVGQAIVVGKEVYVGLVNSGKVLKYNITKESWSILLIPPVKYFSIEYLCQKVILVGGQLRSNWRVTGDINEIDEATQQWIRSTSIPPMPTARTSATAISWTSPPALIVCGGSSDESKPLTAVEVYHSRSSQWHTVSPLPFPRDYMSHTVIHNVLYLVGGYKTSAIGSYTKTVMSASIPQLLESCLQPSRTPPVQWQSGSIPDVPHYYSTAASLGGCLVVVGGSTRPSRNALESSVHAYCPSSSSWVCVGQLPQPFAECITVILPTGELLVLGGKVSQHIFTTAAYKCCLSVEL